ncbi:MAG: divalent-cation tolerance protein CutA [Candidatus Zixiibacteriota bacterium]
MAAYRVVLITTKTDEAEELADQIIAHRLAACVNIINNVKSVFRWKGEVKKETETILLAKTHAKTVENLIKFVRENHSYEVPEVLSIGVDEGNPDYLDWLHEETG